MSTARDVRDATGRLAGWRFFPVLKALAGFGLLASLPYVIDLYFFGFQISDYVTLKILILTLIWAYTAQSWNIMSGFTGQFSFGHAAFFGIGAYTTMVLLVDHSINPWVGMIAGGIVAALYGALIGYLSFRYEVEGHYFALVTLAFAELARYIVANMQELNATQGFYRPFANTYADGPGYIAFQFRDDQPYYYVMLAFLVIVTLAAWAIKRSAIGYYLFAIREDESAARSLGIPVNRYKMMGITVSAFFTAWGGAFWSMYFTTIRPSNVFRLQRNVEIMLPAIVGGFGTIVGPILGAFAVIPTSEIIKTQFTDLPGLHAVVYGVFLIVVVLFQPQGISQIVGNAKGWIVSQIDERLDRDASE
jgi:branched-chain amino acid transport system permease protein